MFDPGLKEAENAFAEMMIDLREGKPMTLRLSFPEGCALPQRKDDIAKTLAIIEGVLLGVGGSGLRVNEVEETTGDGQHVHRITLSNESPGIIDDWSFLESPEEEV